MEQALYTFGVGLRHGLIDGRTGQRREGTLAELEADLHRARAMGAPDEATIARTGPDSVYAAEVLWTGTAQ